jgi:hypothetical protein
MPPIRYSRSDTIVTVRRDGPRLYVEIGGDFTSVSPEYLGVLARWPPIARLREPVSSPLGVLQRIALSIEEPQFAELDWESLFRPRDAWPPERRAIVRVSPVPARVLQYPFRPPLRVLEIGGPLVAEAAMLRVLHRPHPEVCEIAAVELSFAVEHVRAKRWPAVHILHIHGLASSNVDLFARNDDVPGSLDWLLRLAMRWSTRLIVLDDAEPALPALRRLADAIVAGAGPAVFVGGTAAFETLYEGLLHDQPFDELQQSSGAALFAGAGREEALRFSVMGEELAASHSVPPAGVVEFPLGGMDVGLSQRSADELYITLANALTADGAKLKGGKEKGGGGKGGGKAAFDGDPHYESIREAVRDEAASMGVDISADLVDLRSQPRPRKIRLGDGVANRLLSKGLVVRPLDDELEALPDDRTFTVDELTDIIAPRTLTLDDARDPAVEPPFEELVRERSENLYAATQTFGFDHESNGTIPIVVKADTLSKLVRAGATRSSKAVVRPPRHVLGAFYRSEAPGQPEEIEQRSARLRAGEDVQLGVRIGEKQEVVFTLGDTVLREEKLKWDPVAKGCWIEIAVTGIDFDNLGRDDVQKAWLPRDGDMPVVYFALRPRRGGAVPGVARLRFTLFSNNNVVQSFLMAALLKEFEGDERAALAHALGIDAERVEKEVGYLQRLEYHAIDPEQAENAPPRVLSIVANDTAGQEIFSIKGRKFFTSTVNTEVQSLVHDARDHLRSSAVNRYGEYRFGPTNEASDSDLAGLTDLFFGAARAGWSIYDQILPLPEDKDDVAELLAGNEVIHAAHINLEQVVPWPLIYPRRLVDDYKLTLEDATGNVVQIPAAKGICPAGMPRADGEFNTEPCGTLPNCILHGADTRGWNLTKEPYVCRESVVCPRYFWGFSNQIEVPVQQVHEGRDTPPPKTIVDAAPKTTMFVGLNPTVANIGDHLKELKNKLAAMATIKEPLLQERSAILQALEGLDPDVVYFFCHAWRDRDGAPNVYAPNLDFGKRGKGDIAGASDFAGKWTHQPLIFINGCGSVAFSDTAPAALVTKFIQGLNAAAVIGTETTVWTDLATEVGLSFLSKFLAPQPMSAGAALLETRRELLRKNNPLGLIYTLYGIAGLHVAR